MKTVKHDEALSAGRKIKTLTLGRTAGVNGGGLSLVITTEDNLVIVTPLTELRVTAGKLTDNGSSSASLDLTGDGVTVRGDTDLPVEKVKSLVFPDDVFTNLGGGSVLVDTRRVLTVTDADDDPRKYPTTEIRFP